MPKKLKEIPNLKNETEEREFWAENDSTDFVDWELAEPVVLPNLKPPTKTISLCGFPPRCSKKSASSPTNAMFPINH